MVFELLLILFRIKLWHKFAFEAQFCECLISTLCCYYYTNQFLGTLPTLNLGGGVVRIRKLGSLASDLGRATRALQEG